MLSLYFYVYTRVIARAEKDKPIWISKPKPALPFGLGPPPEPLKPEDFDETTYSQHEIKLLMEAAQGILMSGGISFLMSVKFNVHMSLLVQAVMMPLNAMDMLVLKKYLLGTQKNADGSNLYNEFLSQPTLKSLEIAEKLKVARSNLSPGGAHVSTNTKRRHMCKNVTFSHIYRDRYISTCIFAYEDIHVSV
jgi:hypothetical protein